MNRATRAVGIMTTAFLVALMTIPARAEVTKAPYADNIEQALKLAAETGRETLIYFFSET